MRQWQWQWSHRTREVGHRLKRRDRRSEMYEQYPQGIIITIEMKQKDQMSRSSSRNKVESILQEEEQVSKAFRLDNFYHNHRLNIQELKKRLDVFKRKQKQPSPFRKIEHLTQHSPIHSFDEQSTAKFVGLLDPLPEQNNETLAHIKKRLNFDQIPKGYSQQPSHRKQDSQFNNRSGLWAVQQPNKSNQPEMNRYESKYKTVYKPRRAINPAAVASLNSRDFLKRDKIKTSEKTEQSKCSDSLHQKSFQQCYFQGKMEVKSQGQVSQLQNQIQKLWQHYQLLTGILVSLRDSVQRQRPKIIKYIQTVCSKKFQFLKDLLDELLSKSGTKKEIAFAKRLRKAVTLSRVYESLAILHLALAICLGHKCDSHLSNIIGYSTSSITFTIRFLSLLYQLQSPFKFAPRIEDILDAISSYQKTSYGGRINRVSEVTLRIEQNNETIAIVQLKLCSQMDRHFQDTVTSYLKNVDFEAKAYFQYAHYNFQFLAFQLASLGLRGQFGGVEIAPAPYHPPFSKPRTLIIEPWEVLFARKGTTTTFIRSHTDNFLKLIGQYWNIVYWTDLMPKDIDDLLERLPPGLCLYRYHCKYNNHFVKLLERVGCDLQNTLIVDRCEDNFLHNGDLGIALPWKGHRRDVKLLQLLELLDPLFHSNTPTLRNCLGAIRQKFSAKNKKKGALGPVKTLGSQISPYESLPKRLTEYK